MTKKESTRLWQSRNPEKMREYARKSYWANREKYLESNKKYRIANADKLAERRKPVQKEYRKALRHSVLDAYGRECANCGYSADDRALDLDHIEGKKKQGHVGLGNQRIYQIVKKENYPKDKYRVLCRNCNWLEYLNKLVSS